MSITNISTLYFSDSTSSIIGISNESFVHDGESELSRSLVVWNEGNKKTKVSNIRFALNSPVFLNNSNQNFILGYNEAKLISFEIQPQIQGLDTLIFETDAPGFTTIRIPVNAILISNKEKFTAKAPQIFPNPGTDVTYIDNLEAKNQSVKVKIINIQGKLLKEMIQLPNSGKMDFKIGDLPSGIYHVTIEQRNRVDQIRFVKL